MNGSGSVISPVLTVVASEGEADEPQRLPEWNILSSTSCHNGEYDAHGVNFAVKDRASQREVLMRSFKLMYNHQITVPNMHQA